MKGYQKWMMTTVIMVVLLVGVWATLLTEQRCRSRLGHPQPELPCVYLTAEGDVVLEGADRSRCLEGDSLRKALLLAGRVETLLPRKVRIAALAGLSLANLEWSEPPAAAGGKMLVQKVWPQPLDHT